MESDWSLLPGVGLGRLKFGMSPEAYHDFEGVYGEVRRQYETLAPTEEENEIWERAISRFDEKKRSEMEERDRINNEFLRKQASQIISSDIELLYYEQQLYTISAFKDCQKLHLNGLPVFLSDPKEVVLEFARTLNENPLVNGPDVVFRDSFVYLFGFTKGLNWRGKLSYYSLADANDPDADSEAQQRSLSWGTRPRNVVPEDWSQHVLVPLIQP